MSSRFACIALAACLVALSSARVPGVEAANDPRQVVESLTDPVLDILADEKLSTDEKKQRIEDLVEEYVDFEILSRLVLARNWSKFSPEQQKEFMTEFKKHLSLTYGKNIENYRNERVEVIGDREEARGDHTVKTKVLRGGEDFAVDYRLRERDGRWKIIDIIVENVSLVANYRAQFQGIVSDGGPEALLKALHEKNASGQTFKAV
jgi:phospholipid transport system substrate-binding protein